MQVDLRHPISFVAWDHLEQGFKLALKQAQKAYDAGEVPVGAVILKETENGKEPHLTSTYQKIAQGFNTKEQNTCALNHAEILAITKASKKLQNYRLTNCDLLVTLEPCVMCLAAMVQARIRSCWYLLQDPKAGALTLGHNLHQDARLFHQFECKSIFDSSALQRIEDSKKIAATESAQALSDKSKMLLQSFFKEVRKRNRLRKVKV